MALDDVVPGPDHVTRQVRWIAADPPAVWDALHGVRFSGLPLTLALSAARFLPVVLSGRGRGQLRDRPFLDAAALRAWDAPGWVKVAMDFRLVPTRGGTELSSETRVAATDDASRAAFARYWRVIRHGSTAVRWEVLTAVELRATG
jgi:hypothetical protein